MSQCSNSRPQKALWTSDYLSNAWQVDAVWTNIFTSQEFGCSRGQNSPTSNSWLSWTWTLQIVIYNISPAVFFHSSTFSCMWWISLFLCGWPTLTVTEHRGPSTQTHLHSLFRKCITYDFPFILLLSLPTIHRLPSLLQMSLRSPSSRWSWTYCVSCWE